MTYNIMKLIIKDLFVTPSIANCHYTEFRDIIDSYAECHYPECCYAESCNAECHGTLKNLVSI